LERGRRLIEVLKQDQYVPMPVGQQVIIFLALISGFLDNVPVEKIRDFEAGLLDYVQDVNSDLIKEIEKTGELTEAEEKKLQKIIKDYKDTVDYLIKEEEKKL